MEQIKTISVGYLMQQVQSRFKVNHSNWRADALDNVGLIIEEIGYHTGFKSKNVCVEIKNYKAQMPREIVSVGEIIYNGCPLVIASQRDAITTRRLNAPKLRLATSEDVLELDKESKRLKELQAMYLIAPTPELLDAIVDSQRKVSLLVEGVTYQNRLNDIGVDWYEMDGGYIKTSFENGIIYIDADVFQTDDQGLPMVVDTFKYREACIWGMLYYIMLAGYVHPVVTLAYTEGQKDFFVGQARNEPKMLSIDRHQRFTEIWSSITRGIYNPTLNEL